MAKNIKNMFPLSICWVKVVDHIVIWNYKKINIYFFHTSQTTYNWFSTYNQIKKKGKNNFLEYDFYRNKRNLNLLFMIELFYYYYFFKTLL